ncbi:MAG: hypothetical protein GXP49_00900 [Deltaproteobacteria bacterium]|nr:hypothetical protein [Deltaproteobacteria bacterium]
MKQVKLYVTMLFVVSTLSLASIRSLAGGFLIYEQGAAAQGMAGTFVSVANDPTAVYYNPAGLAFQNGIGATAGMSLILTTLKTKPKHVDYSTGHVTTGPSIAADNGLFPIPFAYVSASLGHGVAAGLGVFPHLGLGISWPGGKQWDTGRQEIEKVSLQVLTVNPCISWSPARWISFGLGFDAAKGSIEFQRGIDFMREGWDSVDPSNRFGSAELGGSGWGFGMNFGVLFKPMDELSLGIHYRSRFNLALSGKGSFDVPPSFADTLPDQDLSMEITMPDIIAAGIAYRPLNWLLLQLEVTQVMWSTYDVLYVELNKTPENNMRMEQDFQDTATFRFGLQLDGAGIVQGLDGFKVRTGFIFDLTPVPSTTLGPALPDGNRYDWSFGLGYTISKQFPLTMNLAYILIYFNRDEDVKLDSNNVPVNHWPAAYRGLYHSIGLDVSYKFDL